MKYVIGIIFILLLVISVLIVTMDSNITKIDGKSAIYADYADSDPDQTPPTIIGDITGGTFPKMIVIYGDHTKTKSLTEQPE